MMDAKYYRFLYHPVRQGLCFSASLGAVKGIDGTQILVLGSQAASEGEDDIPDSAKAEHLHFLILTDLYPQTVRKAQKICQFAKVDTILHPYTMDKPALAETRDTVVGEVSQTYELCVSDFKLKLFYSGEKVGNLAVYLGSSGPTPGNCECVMNVKPCGPSQPCSLAVNAANLNCEMRCLLGTDVTQCKKHNRRDETSFVDGHLLLGSADLTECLPELQAYLAEEWDSIRFVSLPQGGKMPSAKGLLDIGRPGFSRYFLGTAEADCAVIKAVTVKDAFSTFVFTGEEAGFCVSGCYAAR